jgi:hypothetical protein
MLCCAKVIVTLSVPRKRCVTEGIRDDFGWDVMRHTVQLQVEARGQHWATWVSTHGKTEEWVVTVRNSI